MKIHRVQGAGGVKLHVNGAMLPAFANPINPLMVTEPALLNETVSGRAEGPVPLGCGRPARSRYVRNAAGSRTVRRWRQMSRRRGCDHRSTHARQAHGGWLVLRRNSSYWTMSGNRPTRSPASTLSVQLRSWADPRLLSVRPSRRTRWPPARLICRPISRRYAGSCERFLLRRVRKMTSNWRWPSAWLCIRRYAHSF